jgi:peroxiredoxin
MLLAVSSYAPVAQARVCGQAGYSDICIAGVTQHVHAGLV